MPFQAQLYKKLLDLPWHQLGAEREQKVKACLPKDMESFDGFCFGISVIFSGLYCKNGPSSMENFLKTLDEISENSEKSILEDMAKLIEAIYIAQESQLKRGIPDSIKKIPELSTLSLLNKTSGIIKKEKISSAITKIVDKLPLNDFVLLANHEHIVSIIKKKHDLYMFFDSNNPKPFYGLPGHEVLCSEIEQSLFNTQNENLDIAFFIMSLNPQKEFIFEESFYSQFFMHALSSPNGQLSLHSAAVSGDLRLLEHLLMTPINRHYKDPKGRNALDFAIDNHQPEALKLLLAHGLSPFYKNLNKSPFLRTIRTSEEMTNHFLPYLKPEMCSLLSKTPEEKKTSIFHFAIRFEREKAVKHMIDLGVSPDMKALLLSLACKNPQIFSLLIDAATPSERQALLHENDTRLLYSAVLYGAEKPIQKMLEYGANPLTVSSVNIHLIVLAALWGHAGIVKQLLPYHPKPTLLSTLFSSIFDYSIGFFLNRPIYPSQAPSVALAIAQLKNHSDCVRFLSEANIQPLHHRIINVIKDITVSDLLKKKPKRPEEDSACESIVKGSFAPGYQAHAQNKKPLVNNRELINHTNKSKLSI